MGARAKRGRGCLIYLISNSASFVCPLERVAITLYLPVTHLSSDLLKVPRTAELRPDELFWIGRMMEVSFPESRLMNFSSVEIFSTVWLSVNTEA